MADESLKCLACGADAVTFHSEVDGVAVDLNHADCQACGASHGRDPETQAVFLEDDGAPAPTDAPVDADEERERLLRDSAARGVDEDAALELADNLAHTQPLPDALRGVDRRVATGESLDEAAEGLDVAPPSPETHKDG